jgi:pyruvate dehydrogenase E1 component
MVAMDYDGIAHQLPDLDPTETEEWLAAVDDVVRAHGPNRARYLLARVMARARQAGVDVAGPVSTPYVNTIPSAAEPDFPGDEDLERRIRRYVRWNAAVMVVRANLRSDAIGGHLATYASSAALYEVGFNHFFRGKDHGPGDQVYFQGHASPGIYARAFVEGRLDEHQLDNFRFEVGGDGLSSYPHPRLMPDFWEYPTVSMGLGPVNAIAQAHLARYLAARGLADTSQSRVWAFVGDGEFDEPETMALLGMAGREHLDNLTMVVNCNLQRLDGPVRGNGKVIQEFEATLRGAGWNVIKVVWGRTWDELLARDVDGLLLARMEETVDGEFQKYATESGAYIREHFFGPDPRLRALVDHLSDAELQSLPRGGHDYRKLYAAYRAATEHTGAPTAILAKTVKGWTLGPQVESRNATHQIKKLSTDQLRMLRDRLSLQEELPDAALDADLPPYCRPDPDSAAGRYLAERRRVLGGPLPSRVVRAAPLPPPDPAGFADLLAGSGRQAVSTTMAFARLLRSLTRDPGIGPRVVPIVSDEARTFGLESLISEAHIYAPGGQRYTPVDAGLALHYAESANGQVLEEGITETGATASFTAAATAYATWGESLIPCYLFYSMFGFQRVGDLLWALGDARGRGFLLGCTAGRTTLNGEGLQHQDGHSLLLASAYPSVAAYDPAFAYEVAVLVEDGIRRMTGPDPEDRYWYLTLYNENYVMPALPEDPAEAERVRRGTVRGMYRFAGPPTDLAGDAPRATILFSGTAWQAAAEARERLAAEWGVAAETWSVTSYKSLREDAVSAERHARLHPGDPARVPLVTAALSGGAGPVVAVTDFVRAVPDQVARWVPRPYTSLGTDGFGRSDTREVLRRFFETDAAHVVVAVLRGLEADGAVPPGTTAKALGAYGVDPDLADPWSD